MLKGKLTVEDICERLIQKLSHIEIIKDTFISNESDATFTCKKHGVTFVKKVRKIFESAGCKKCSSELQSSIRQLSFNDIISRFLNIHGNTYNYDDINPDCIESTQTKVSIICHKHGKFLQKIGIHLSGSGCPKCNKPGWSDQDWINFCKLKNRDLTFYVIKLYNSSESFIKMGMTTRDIKQRLQEIKEYKSEIIFTITGHPKQLVNLDKKLLKIVKHLKYNPIREFGGKTECISEEFSKILEQIFTHETAFEFIKNNASEISKKITIVDLGNSKYSINFNTDN